MVFIRSLSTKPQWSLVGVAPWRGEVLQHFKLTLLVHPVSSSYQEKLSGKEMQVLSLEMVMAGPKVPGSYG